MTCWVCGDKMGIGRVAMGRGGAGGGEVREWWYCHSCNLMTAKDGHAARRAS